MYFSPLVERIGGDGADAWEIHRAAIAAYARGEDVLVMSVGDPDFATPEPISEAAIAALRAGDTHYTEWIGRTELRAQIAAAHQERSGVPTNADNVIVLAGAQCGLFSAAQCIGTFGDEMIVLDPSYVTYEATIRACGADIVRAQPIDDGRFRPDSAAIAAAITARTKAIFFATPNNPTGVAYNQAELEDIAELARQHDLWIVSDEVYADLLFEGEHCSVAGLPGMAERTVTISSLSKSHAMAGWRSGWVIAPVELTNHLSNLSLCMLYGLPGFVQAAAVSALRDGAAAVAQMREIYRRRRDLVIGALSEQLGDVCRIPQAGMFLLMDIRATGMSGGEFCRALYRDCGVSVLDASAFGASATGFVRLSFTLDEARLVEGCRRIINFVTRRQSEGVSP